MSEPTIEEEESSSRDPKRPRLCLRALTEALSKWRLAAEELAFTDDVVQKKGGSADIAKATKIIPECVGTEDRNLGTVQNVAVKKLRFGGDINRNTQIAVSPLWSVPDVALLVDS
ncbi:hypothetical protein FRC00_003079 [Tulasnella sp. 408]|nr:hypothetical protein FRC00_003079 [Tulasnella sp. 408]